jgi:hypothetical protein
VNVREAARELGIPEPARPWWIPQVAWEFVAEGLMTGRLIRWMWHGGDGVTAGELFSGSESADW